MSKDETLASADMISTSLHLVGFHVKDQLIRKKLKADIFATHNELTHFRDTYISTSTGLIGE